MILSVGGALSEVPICRQACTHVYICDEMKPNIIDSVCYKLENIFHQLVQYFPGMETLFLLGKLIHVINNLYISFFFSPGKETIATRGVRQQF